MNSMIKWPSNNIISSKSLIQSLDRKSQNKTKKPLCQLCCKPNFPMKNLNDHFYHITCLFMFELAQVKNYKIILRQQYTYEQIIKTVTQNQLYSQICEFCLKGTGMKHKCSYLSCKKWYHPICAYLNGTFFDIERKFRSMDVKIICSQHKLDRNCQSQIFLRRFFCDYKKTSDFTEEDFKEEYNKQVKQLAKQRAKLYKNDNLLLRKFKTLKNHLLSLNHNASNVNCNNSNKKSIQQYFSQSNQKISVCQNSQINQSQNLLEKTNNQFVINQMKNQNFNENV